MTAIPIVIGVLGIVTEGLAQGLEDLKIKGRVETTQTTASLRSAIILRRVLEIEETCCQSDSSGKPQGENQRKWKTGQVTGPYQRPKKMLGNRKVTVIPNVSGTLRTIPTGLKKRLEELEIRRRAGTIQSISLLRSARILRRVLEIWGDLQ